MTYFRQVYEDLPATIALPLLLRHRRVEVLMLAVGRANRQRQA